MAVAEIFLTAIIQVLFEKLASPEFITFVRREFGVHAAIKKWTDMLTLIKGVLEDAEQKQIMNVGIKSWLEKLEDLAYDVDDMLDEFATEALRQQVEVELDPESSSSSSNSTSTSRKVRSFIPACCTNFTPSAFKSKLRIRSMIKEINSRFEDICEQRTKLGLERIVGETSTSTRAWQKPTSTSLVIESRVYGRDEDKQKIIKLLLNDSATSGRFCVIPIVGMGGVGKTTLAQLVYNNERVKLHFDLKAWVCVSDDFDAKKILKIILESVSPAAFVSEDLNQVQIKVKEALTGKKFLIVLDDVWNNKPTDWDALWIPFEAGACDSKVIVTTCDREIALRVGTDQNHCHYLNQLSDVDCWSVFEQYAFENRNDASHQNLELIGKKIVEKCNGLPLAARALGGILRSKLEENEWEKILNSKIWDLPEKESDILPVLRLSYYHLPSHLKRCFAYCSILPQDYEFGEEEIVLLWMAEGFLQQQEEAQMKELGHAYFCDLLSRSFFQQSTSDTSLFVMHDLIHDLAQWVAGEKCFRLEDNLEHKRKCKISKRTRHASYIGSNNDGIKKFKAFDEVQHLRTFLPVWQSNYGGCYLTNYVPSILLPKLRCLRVLSLQKYKIVELPNSIGDLKHLRFVNLSDTPIRKLPESVSTLYNLQTLILRNCQSLEKLPANFKNLLNLCHLDIIGIDSLKEMPLGIDKLIRLQTLSNFIVGESSGSRIRELGNLLHLGGALDISNLEYVNDASHAKEARLNDKKAVDVLELKWSREFDSSRRNERNIEEKTLDMLKPHKNLKKLTIQYYGGTRLPAWLADGSLTYLVFLRLEGCLKCASLPSLGQLPVLKDVVIRKMNGVSSVGIEFNGGVGCQKPFPSLETLSFEEMLEWENWFPCEDDDDHMEVFPCLRKLSINYCPKLVGKLPDCLSSLEELEIEECEQLRVSISSLPKLCKLEMYGCQEVVYRSTDSLNLSQLKSVTLSDVSKLTWLVEGFGQGLRGVENLVIGGAGCNELTCLWQKEAAGLLQNLNSLRALEISRCPQLVSLVGEEQQQEQPCPFSRLESLEISGCDNLEKLQGLHCLTSLRELTIDVCPRLVSSSETETETGLQLPPMLRKLRIERCRALKSLHLVVMQCGPQVSSKLESLELWGCDNLEELRIEGGTFISFRELTIIDCRRLLSFPETGLPPSIRELTICHCADLESLHLDMMSLLEDLYICSCHSLTSLSSRTRGEFELPATLKHLIVWDCSKLESVAERFHNNTSSFLESIRIWGCGSLTSLPEGLHNLTHLSQLWIDGCPNLVSFPDGGGGGGLPATNLRLLRISNCEKLETLPHLIHNLTSLQDLRIRECPGIVSFPEEEEGFPTSLTSLEIEDMNMCKPLFDWGLHRLTSLRRLTIVGPCPDLLVFFPHTIILPNSLIHLSIKDFPNLEYLSSFKNLTSLEMLYISDCPNLKSFPKEKEGLPLSLLQLYIKECPLLKKRCKKDKGRDWPKIAHIPYIHIDGRLADSQVYL